MLKMPKRRKRNTRARQALEKKVNSEIDPTYKDRTRKQSLDENLVVSVRNISMNKSEESCTLSGRDEALQFPASGKLTVDPETTENHAETIVKTRKRSRKRRKKRSNPLLQNNPDVKFPENGSLFSPDLTNIKHFEKEGVNCFSQATEIESVRVQNNNEPAVVNSILAEAEGKKVYQRKNPLKVYQRKRRELSDSVNTVEPANEEDTGTSINFAHKTSVREISNSSDNALTSDGNMKSMMNDDESNKVQKSVLELGKEKQSKQVPDMCFGTSKNKLERLKEVSLSSSLLVVEESSRRDVSVDCPDTGLESGSRKKRVKKNVKRTTCGDSSIKDTSMINLCDEQFKQENEDKPSNIHTVCEPGICMEKNLDESKTYCKDKKLFPLEGGENVEHVCGSSIDLMYKQDNLSESCKDGCSTSSLVLEDVPKCDSSADSSFRRPSSRKRIQREKASDNIIPSDHSPKLLEQKNEEISNDTERLMKEFHVCGDRNLEVSLTELKIEKENISSSNEDAINDVVSLTVINEADNPSKVPHSSPRRALTSRTQRKLLILDLNGLLADIVSDVPDGYKPDKKIARKALFKRPFTDDFLKFCFERFDIGIWSSRMKRNVDSVVDFLIGDMKQNLLFCWDQSHCTETGFNTVENKHKPLVLKELKKLWDKHEPNLPWQKGEYNESNTLLVDDSPYKALRNPPHTSIFPYPYRFQDIKDNSLGVGHPAYTRDEIFCDICAIKAGASTSLVHLATKEN